MKFTLGDKGFPFKAGQACRSRPGFTTAMDGGSAGAVGSGSSKNLEALSRVKLIAHRLDGFARIFLLPA
ncbi:MAG: hypothetical protein Q8S52_02020, partial [Methylobacter sp.]|nr:hypothetical protein [Methylobacter sp.]